MSATATAQSTENEAVSVAISDLETQIVQHSKSARWVAIAMAGAFLLLLLAGTVMHLVETVMAIRVTSEFNLAMDKVARNPAVHASQQPPGMPATYTLDMQLRPQIDAIANHAKSAGVQYYNALLLSGAAVFALVFGLLMAVYRHYLTEISKLQHYKTAFTRIRVAVLTASSGDRTALAQASLVDRAFEYRSGKEKQIDSPMPGHPMSDASSVLMNKLLDVLEATKKT